MQKSLLHIHWVKKNGSSEKKCKYEPKNSFSTKNIYFKKKNIKSNREKEPKRERKINKTLYDGDDDDDDETEKRHLRFADWRKNKERFR